MLTLTAHTFVIVLVTIILPSALSFPYPFYGMNNNYRRASRANSNSPSFPSSSSSSAHQRYDQSNYRSPSASSYYGNYDTLYDSGADNYYVDDESDDRPEREYLYGKPTYHGEYKPTRYYYARAPSYNSYNDQPESTNPMDDLHEEMLQEEQHERQRNFPTGKPSWFQNSGQPKSLTSNFMKNLMLYNNGINVDAQPNDMGTEYDDDEMENPYSNDQSNQNEPYDYYELLKFQPHQFNHFEPSPANKQTYFNQENRKDTDYYAPNKNLKHNDYDEKDSHEEKEEKDLESLRKNHVNAWDRHDNEKPSVKHAASIPDTVNKHEDAYNGGYDAGFDYDDDEWINWDRKRSLPNKQNDNLRPLKVLEYQLTKAIQEQGDVSKVLSTTMPPTTTTTTTTPSSNIVNNKVHEHKGQKEVVLSRPATPLRRHFSDSVIEALTKTTNELQQTKQELDAKDDDKQQHGQQHSSPSKKHKRFVSSETSLVQQLNGLKRKIKA